MSVPVEILIVHRIFSSDTHFARNVICDTEIKSVSVEILHFLFQLLYILQKSERDIKIKYLPLGFSLLNCHT